VPQVNLEEHNAREIASELMLRLTQFNEAHAGSVRKRDVALTVRSEDGVLIGGLTGELFWNALYVHLLWVDEDYRRQRYGTMLLARAEQLAVEQSCTVAYLSTFGFQAPGFYAGRGYSVIGELADVPPGSKRQWFSKVLTASE